MDPDSFFASVGLGDGEYRAIGQIAIASGILESRLRSVVHKLAGLDHDTAAAITSHLSYASLSDMALALCHDGLRPSVRRRNAPLLEAAIKKARVAYDKRSYIMHGPFIRKAANPDAIQFSAIMKTSARAKLVLGGMAFAPHYFERLRDDLLASIIEIEDQLHMLTPASDEQAPRR